MSNPLAELMGAAVEETLSKSNNMSDNNISFEGSSAAINRPSPSVVGSMLADDDDNCSSESSDDTDVESGDVVLNPEAVRKGLTKARGGSCIRAETIVAQKQLDAVTVASAMKSEVRTETAGVAFGIAYSKMRVPGETQKRYNLPSGPSFKDEKAFEKDLKESEMSCQCVGDADPPEASDDEFDIVVDTSLCVKAFNPAIPAFAPLNPPLPPNAPRLSPNGHATSDVANVAQKLKAETHANATERLSASSAKALLKMHMQYAAGLTDEAAAAQREEQAKAFEKAIDISAPLDALVEEEEEEEEYVGRGDCNTIVT